MKMAKASEKDIDAAGNAMALLNTVDGGYFPAGQDEENAPLFFDHDDIEHLRRFYDDMKATMDASPGWPGRVIGGMCYVILYDKNEIVDPNSDVIELHPKFAAASARIAELETELASTRVQQGEMAELETELTSILPGSHYMDPPDGGDVSLVEQIRRMAADAARYRELRDVSNGYHGLNGPSGIGNFNIAQKRFPGEAWYLHGLELDIAVDAAIASSQPLEPQ